MKKPNRTAEHWKTLMQEYEASGMSQKAFCIEQGIPLSSFSRWRKRLKKDAEPIRENKLVKITRPISEAGTTRIQINTNYCSVVLTGEEPAGLITNLFKAIRAAEYEH